MRGFTKNGVNLDVCAYCKCPIDEYSATTDHLYPKSRGGKLSNDNKMPSCGDCNKLKGSMDIINDVLHAVHCNVLCIKLS